MGLTVSTLTPAIEKAKNVATESYVDSTVNTASAALEAAYIEYNNTVKQALIDGEISDAEATAIAAAETKVNDAKTLLNATIVTASNTALSNANAYTNSAISGSGFVLPSGVAAAINNNTTTINGSKITTGSIAAAQIAANTITSDKISTYNLTAANSTFQNSIITNAAIANGAITNAKIGDASIDAAKIIDGNITNAKIGYASVDTLKIQGEAIVVPRFAEAIGSNRATIYYTPTVTHTVLLICNVQWSTGEQYYVIGVNGAVHKNGRMGSYGSSTFTKAFSISTLVTLSAGVAYSLTFQLSGNGAYSNTAVSEWTQITMMGAKR